MVKRRNRKANGTLSDYYDKLGKEGWEYLDSGYYAQVYVKGSTVLKVSVEDEAYDEFLDVALKNQSNPLYPKIYSVDDYKKVIGPLGDFCHVTVTTMERLDSHAKFNVLDTWGESANPSAKHLSNVLRKLIPPANANERRVLKNLAPLLQKYDLDLHRDNVLFRDNQPVITDPFSEKWGTF